MKKLFVLSGLLIFAMCAFNVMATVPENESAEPVSVEMTKMENSHLRPFKGTVSYTPTEVPHVATGVGQATHMGRVTVESYCENGVFGEDTFIAADGSEATMSWSFEFISEDFTSGYGTWEWTSGTGRFEDISGSGTFTAVITTTLNLNLIGTISY